NSTVSGNHSDRDGGGIDNTGNATLTNVTVTDNDSDIGGGGILNDGSATLTNVTIHSNLAGFGDGGGILNNASGTLTIFNGTISGNYAVDFGGGIFSDGTASAANTIVLGNVAVQGIGDASTADVAFTSSIVGGTYGAPSPQDVFSAIDNSTYSGTGGLLGDNGGAVETVALKADVANPALDAADEAVAGTPATDARGQVRFDFPGVANSGASITDLSAFELEVQPNQAPVVTFVSVPTTVVDIAPDPGTIDTFHDGFYLSDFSFGQSQTLRTIAIYADAGFVGPDFAGSLSWAIYEDNAGTPGARLFDGEDATPLIEVVGSLELGTLTLPGVTLPAGTYWFAVREGAWADAFDGTAVGWAVGLTNPGAAPLHTTFGLPTGHITDIDGPFTTGFGGSHSFVITADSGASPLTATEQVALDLKAQILVDDPDSALSDVTATLAVDTGILNVTAGTSGVVVAGSGTAMVTLTGTIAEIMDLLETNATSTVSFLADSDDPPASVDLTVTVNDGGATGTGGPLETSNILTITITPVNDAPN
ncbi:MAG: right-handed parallel beta-helix repeat-containing protein, partial [Novosphingobium sp.]|nr:right-handed parallel beta-helix repeat-containing protein [Novosphingobium sp.]